MHGLVPDKGSVYRRGGIAKAPGLDDGPTHRKDAIVKGGALGDATRTVSYLGAA